MTRTAVVVAGLILAVAAAACDDESAQPTPAPVLEASATPTETYVDLKATEAASRPPTATPIPAVRDCPTGINTQPACDAALYLVRQLRGSGVDYLAKATERVEVSCGANLLSVVILCEGVHAGEKRAGLIYANKRFVILPEQQYRERASLNDYSRMELVGIGCPQSPANTLDCSRSVVVALDPDPREPLAEPFRLTVLLLAWNDGDPVVMANYTGGYVGREAFAGGPQRYPLPGIGQDVNVWWQPWRPNDR